MGNNTCKFFAFISYRHTDIWAAKKLQSLLEGYNLPTEIKARVKDAPEKYPQLTLGGLELLGIDVQAEQGWCEAVRFHKAFIRTVAKMLGLDFGCIKATTDEQGLIDILIPLQHQQRHYDVRITHKGAQTL